MVAPAQAQNFQNGSAETIWNGNLRLTGSPAWLFGVDDGPNRTGGAFRLGYGITDALDVEAKTGFFNGVTLVGGDGHYRFLTGRTSMALTAGGHKALMEDSIDSTALDLRGATEPGSPPSARDLRWAGLLLRDPRRRR